MKNRLWLIVPWTLFAFIVAGWIGYWFFVAAQSERSVRAWVSEQTQNGGEASIARIVRHGFPVLLRLELQDVAYAPTGESWSIRTDRADLNVDLLNPQHVIIASEAPIAIAREGGETSVLDADALIVSVETHADELVLAGVEADQLTLDDPAKDGVLRVGKLVVNLRPDPRTAGEYQIAFEASHVNLPRPVRSFEQFGFDIETLRTATVITHGAALFDGGDGDPLAPWREAGGRLRFEAITLKWGPLDASGAGEGGLDAERRLAGHLTLPIAEPAPLFSALANGPNVDENARRMLGLLAASFRANGNGMDLDVDAANGVLALEGFHVRSLPPAY